MNKIILNLKDKSCQDIMSIPRLFEKLTGKNMEDSKLFAPLAKFNVDSVNVDRNTKDVSFAASAKEPFQLMPGTSVKVWHYTYLDILFYRTNLARKATLLLVSLQISFL